MADLDREVLFSNERLVIGMLQVVSGGATVAAFAQAEAIMDLAGYNALRIFLTLMIFALATAVLAAYFKHQYKLWDQKAAASLARSEPDEAKRKARRSAFYLGGMRKAMAASALSVAAALVMLIVFLWIAEPSVNEDQDDDQSAKQSLRV